MGRKPGSKNKPKPVTEAMNDAMDNMESDAAENPRAVAGHNELTEEQRTVLLYQHKRRYADALQAKKTADALLKNVAKVAKAELGEDAVAEIKLMIEAETEEGEAAIKAAIELRTRVLKTLGVPVTQESLFPAFDATPSDDKAYEHGKRDAMAGNNRSAEYHPSTSQSVRYNEGYDKGQELLIMNKIKPLDADDAPELIPAGEQERRDAERLAAHDEAQGEAAPADDFGDTVDEAQRRMRVEAGLTAGLSSLAAEQAATIGDRKPTLREVN